MMNTETEDYFHLDFRSQQQNIALLSISVRCKRRRKHNSEKLNCRGKGSNCSSATVCEKRAHFFLKP